MGRIFALGILGTIESTAVTAASPPVTRVTGAWCILGLLLVPSLAGAQTGIVTGVVTTTAKGVAPLRVTIDQKVCGPELPDEAIVVDAQGRLANAVVILTGVKRAAPAAPLVMNEKCRFAPRVQLIAATATVTTTSKDAVLHTTNAQLENGRTLFNVALPIPGITITKAIRASGPVRLSCNTHPWMRGWMVVTDQAAAISGADGRFSINDVPPGTYELRVWHERLKAAPQKITVGTGKPTEVTLQLK